MDNSVAILLQPLIQDLRDAGVEVTVYLFGSSLDQGLQANDIDLLFVYADPGTPNVVRALLQRRGIPFPVHPLFLHHDEDAEFDFRNVVGAVRLYPTCFE